MLELIKELIKMETLTVDKYRSKGHRVVRPSTVLIGLVGLFYALSPIDLVPELLVNPLVFGLIDDLIIVTVVGVFIYSDIGGVLSNAVEQRIQDGGVSRTKEDTPKAPVPLELKRERHTSDVPFADTSVNIGNPKVEVIRDDADASGDVDNDDPDDTKIAEFMAELGLGFRLDGTDNDNPGWGGDSSSGDGSDDGDRL